MAARNTSECVFILKLGPVGQVRARSLHVPICFKAQLYINQTVQLKNKHFYFKVTPLTQCDFSNKAQMSTHVTNINIGRSNCPKVTALRTQYWLSSDYPADALTQALVWVFWNKHNRSQTTSLISATNISWPYD